MTRFIRAIGFALTLGLLAVGPVGASSGAIGVDGRQAFTETGPCAGAFQMTGDLVGCWTTDSFVLVAATPSGMVVGKGTETFTGCIGARCGTLSFRFVFVGSFNAVGAELWGGCHHPITGGTGAFAGATGEVNFVDLPDGSGLPPADYQGHIVLDN